MRIEVKKQFQGGDCMAPGGAAKALLATRPHALAQVEFAADESIDAFLRGDHPIKVI
jgi:hypothetical protein